MTPATSADAVRAFLTALDRRRRRVVLLSGAGAGLLVALAAALALRPWAGSGELWIAAAVAGAVIGAAVATLHGRRAVPIAVVAERSAASRNVILTAAELLERSDASSPAIRAAVLDAAARALLPLDARRMLPAARAVALLGGALAAWSVALLLLVARPDALPALVPRAVDPTGIENIDVVITRPAYAGGDTVRLRDPDRIEALAGSVLTVTVRARAESVAVETVAGRQQLSAADEDTFTGSMRADADGFLSFEPTHADGRAAVRRLIGVSVVPDSVPRVRITTPAADLRLEDGNRTVDIVVEASDDIGLATLRLGYTKVTGFGEQFTFLEGDVPFDVTREAAGHWTARARWPLGGLELQRGDIVVYRATATDHRPGAPAGESDSWVIELVAEAAGIGGFAGDEELDRYALSQQMIVVLTERLIARRGSLAPDELTVESRTLAAAQRTVRAGFLFMLGGELEDEHEAETGLMELHEEAHARIDEEVAEGRLASQGRIDLARAIQAMSHAFTLLTAADLDEALRAEQTALIFVQRAFSRSRYIMRALTEREQLDASRRLTGALADALPRARPRVEPPVDERLEQLRAVLADAAALAGADAFDDEAAARVSALAGALLRIDAAAAPLQSVASAFTAAAADAARGRAADARAQLGSAVIDLGAYVRAQMNDAPRRGRPASLDRLEGAMTDALRTTGGRPAGGLR